MAVRNGLHSADAGETPSSNHLAAGQTLLAWRRTALQVAVLGIVAARLLTDRFGIGVVIASVVGVAVGVLVHASAGHAYGEATGRGGHLNRRGKATVAKPQVRLAMLAGLTLAVGVGALVWILGGTI
ncbi:hypothetical protein LGT39_05645 [Demequina sp. TTPB684]|uniref:DUF202 domain-containing protein n=1 Tax=unclassified Demequina TaxID=2620311 RepID=UPI001CF210B3|nr:MULTISPECIES: DUF202 domain-containing protein [unclassified Demequina]MCB2412330.1 hypothetical protein [Demequina sp. TTPB684]UPU89475.1 hypothetical protein LGT36_005985 [Demequina sp. TMPB413]